MHSSRRPSAGWFGPPPALLIGLGVAVAGLVFSLELSSSRSENGGAC